MLCKETLRRLACSAKMWYKHQKFCGRIFKLSYRKMLLDEKEIIFHIGCFKFLQYKEINYMLL